ncbi:MAG: hypothetical protein A2048_01635 [Deltaproteobacteria bacterium GWA2_45_12]|nr:MAG: hypothetical protein A2048_01635 [Deltaproteobacteria bacterium GWA2_45_12]
MTAFEPKPFGKFFLIDRLAIGGMAEIYKAKTFGVDGFEKTLAIKKILHHYSADKEFISMLTDEAKLVVRLSHTNIVQIYDLGKIGDDYYISMEYIDGVNLREVSNRAKELNEKIPLPLCLYIISEVCKGLDYAHSKRDEFGKPLEIVHRDISPQNILISFEGESKIVDFGIAKAAMNISHTSSGILKGKVTYMSPEQAIGKPVDGRTDIFSAGLLLYELITGERCFSGETQFEVLKKIRETNITPEIFAGKISAEVAPILAKALAYLPKDRFETAADFQVALTKLLYTKYNDFSPKQLALFIKKWFASELKSRKAHENQATIDSHTKSVLMEQAAQKAIVQRQDSISHSTDILVDTTKPEDAIHPDMLVHQEITNNEKEEPLPTLPSASKRKKLPLLFLAILLSVLGLTFWLVHKTSNKIPSPIPKNAPKFQEAEIEVSSTPSGASIFVDGQNTDEVTPFKIAKLDPKKEHVVKLIRDNFEPWQQTIRFDNSSTLKIEASLKEIISTGSLQIDSTPQGASIFLNDWARSETTPATLTGLSFQDYTVRLEKENFISAEKIVSVTGKDPVAVNLKLEAIPLGTVVIRSNPPGANIILNGMLMGWATPQKIEKLKIPQNYEIKLQKEGFEEVVKNVPLENSNPVNLTLALKPIEKPKPVVEKSTPPQPKQTKKSTSSKETTTPTPKETKTKIYGVRVDSRPRGASVLFNGSKMGITPIFVSNIKAGSQNTVTLSLPGYKSWTKTFQMGQNRLEINAPLEKE